VRRDTSEKSPLLEIACVLVRLDYVARFIINPKDSAEIDRRVPEEFVPVVKKAKGFVRYYWLATGKGEGASVSVFKDKAGADESVHLAADYVKEHLSKFSIQKPEIIEGPIKAHD
jgi:hypothetical protein